MTEALARDEDFAPPVPSEEAIAFLASLSRRAEALESIPPTCPFDQHSVASAILAKLSEQPTLGQAAEVYAHAWDRGDFGNSKFWRTINAIVTERFGPVGLNHVRKIAANINRENGAMPCPRV
jgi:hypothetical protein